MHILWINEPNILIELLYIHLCVYVCGGALCTRDCLYLWRPDAVDPPGARVTGPCEPPDRDAWN